MSDSILNHDEKFGKVVGRRTLLNPEKSAQALQKFLIQLNKIQIPKGVYRFRTHQEANEWMDKILTQTQRT